MRVEAACQAARAFPTAAEIVARPCLFFFFFFFPPKGPGPCPPIRKKKARRLCVFWRRPFARFQVLACLSVTWGGVPWLLLLEYCVAVRKGSQQVSKATNDKVLASFPFLLVSPLLLRLHACGVSI